MRSQVFCTRISVSQKKKDAPTSRVPLPTQKATNLMISASLQTAATGVPSLQ